jgi:hypothetical protein
MNKSFIQFLFILFGIIFVLNHSLSREERLADLESKIDRLETFFNLDLDADEEVEDE